MRQYLAVMQQHAIREYVPPYWIAVLYVRLGDKDKALEWLARSLAERDDGPLGLKVDPTYDSIRSDDRFQDLLRRVALSP